MKIKKLSLTHFRNHEEREVLFSSGINIILGENGRGKTNILEAVFALSFSKPFRSSKKEVFVQHSKEYSRLKGDFYEDISGNEEQLEIFWGMFPKKINKYKKNDIFISASEYVQEKKFLSILFSPEEMNLPISVPEKRRKYLSRVLSPLFPEYFRSSLRYNTILKQRNALLKKYFEGGVEKSEFAFWDKELAIHHVIIQRYRKEFFSDVNKSISAYYSDISKTEEEVDIRFMPSLCDVDTENFEAVLGQNFENDVKRGRTLLGSHRDDFHFFLRGFPLEESASRGETRTTILALKKCEQEFVQKFGKSSPILLLDDVFSELDLFHQEHLLHMISQTQSIITATELHCSLESLPDVKIHKLGE